MNVLVLILAKFWVNASYAIVAVMAVIEVIRFRIQVVDKKLSIYNSNNDDNHEARDVVPSTFATTAINSFSKHFE